MESFILNHSKGLVEETKAKSRTVQFIHESVRDFFLQGKGLDKLYFGPAATFPARSHENLKQCCQKYLLGVDVTSNLALTGSLPKASLEDSANLCQRVCESFPFLEYAVHNVLYHSDAADGVGCPQNEFIGEFPLSRWNFMNNLLQRYDIRRHSSNVSLLYILAEEDLPSLIRIVRRHVETIGIRGERYGSPLLAARAAGNEKALRALLTLNEHEESELHTNHDGSSPSDHDLREAVSSLVEKELDIKVTNNTTLLFWAAQEGEISIVKILLASRNIDVNARDNNGLTPLLWSAQRGDINIARILLTSRNIDVNAGDNSGLTPLLWSAQREDINIARILLASRNIDVNVRDKRDTTPLLWAARNGHSEVVKLLLAHDDIVINTKDGEYYHETPLLGAARNGHLEVVKLLLAHNDIQINTKDEIYDRTPLLWAAKIGYSEVVKLLLL